VKRESDSKRSRVRKRWRKRKRFFLFKNPQRGEVKKRFKMEKKSWKGVPRKLEKRGGELGRSGHKIQERKGDARRFGNKCKKSLFESAGISRRVAKERSG